MDIVATFDEFKENSELDDESFRIHLMIWKIIFFRSTFIAIM